MAVVVVVGVLLLMIVAVLCLRSRRNPRKGPTTAAQAMPMSSVGAAGVSLLLYCFVQGCDTKPLVEPAGPFTRKVVPTWNPALYHANVDEPDTTT